MSEQQQQQQKLRITCSQRALLSDLSVLLLEQYEGTIGASSDEGSKEDLDPIYRWIGSTPGAMDLLVELSCTTATVNDASKDVMASDDSNRSRPDTAEVYTTGPTEFGQLKSAGVALPGMKAPAVKGVMQPTLATVPEQASPAANPQKADDREEGPKSKLLSNLVDELILLLSNTPWMCASLAQLLPLLSAASKDLVRQQQVTQGDLISASGEDLTLVTGTDILVYTGAVERMAALLQAQQQQQQQGTPNGQQGLQTPLGSLQQHQPFVLGSPGWPSGSPFMQGGSNIMLAQSGGILASPLPPQQTIQQAMRLQAAHAAAGGGGSTPGMFQTELARPVLGEGHTQPKRGVLDMKTLVSSPQLAALIKEVSFLLLTAGSPGRQLLLSELGTRISAQSRMFLKLNRTRLGQLLLRFPKDFVIEGQKASGKVTLIHPEVIQCPSTPVPLEKDIVHDNTTADDMKISAESPSGMEKNDTQGNVFSQAGRNYYGDTTLDVPGNDGSTLTLSARSVGYLKNSRLADLGMGLSVDVLGLTKGIVQHGQVGNGDKNLYMAPPPPQQLPSSPLPLVSPGTALGLTPFSALPRSMVETVLRTPAPRQRDQLGFSQEAAQQPR